MNIPEVLKIEQTIRDLVSNIRGQVVDSIKERPLEGVEKVSDRPDCFTISFSALQQGGILSPQYYSPVSQARAVEQALSGVETASELMKKVTKMINTEHIREFPLNKETVRILKEFVRCDNEDYSV